MTSAQHHDRRDDHEDLRHALKARAGELVRQLLGEPNAALSSATELRYGSRGSLSVELTEGVFFDHETGEGGDLFDLIMREQHHDDFLRAVDFARDFVGGDVRVPPPQVNGKQHASSINVVATYDYVDEGGALLFQVCRLEPKDFRQRRKPRADDPPDAIKGDGWVWSTKGVRQVPYRLPQLLETGERVVVVVEGERDVDNLWKLGVPASCNAGGAGKWRDELSEFFRGADVVVIPDRDPQKKHPKTGDLMFHPDGRPVLPGQDHARMVAASLHGVAARVRVLELWKHWPQMPEKGDVSDWISGGGTAEALYALIEQTPDYHSDDGKPKSVSAGMPVAPANSEEFLALVFVDRHEADLRFVAKWGQWFRWDGWRWALEETLRAFELARLICREAANACNKPGTAKTLASAKTVAAIERLAKADRKVAATFEQWDIDQNSINTSEEN